MSKEIERKFLVNNDSWKNYVVGMEHLIQAYITHRINGTVRLRICDTKAFITIKGRTKGIERHEWEYEIPIEDAREMLANRIYQGKYIEKTRYYLNFNGYRWEIDVFHGRHEGLVMAEIELPDSYHVLQLPSFIGKEVSHDPRYFNSNLNRGSSIL